MLMVNRSRALIVSTFETRESRPLGSISHGEDELGSNEENAKVSQNGENSPCPPTERIDLGL
jgi:hypothetical protein